MEISRYRICQYICDDWRQNFFQNQLNYLTRQCELALNPCRLCILVAAKLQYNDVQCHAKSPQILAVNLAKDCLLFFQLTS